MLRQHQFEKVEMVSVTHPDASRAELDRMTACAEGILERLGLPYRTVVLCTGDMALAHSAPMTSKSGSPVRIPTARFPPCPSVATSRPGA